MPHCYVLRQPEFDALLEWLAPTREQAGEKYEAIRGRLLGYFERHQCVPADEHADETIDRVARRVSAGERIAAADPIRYFYGVARNVLLEYRKHQAVLLRTRTIVPLVESPSSRDLSCLACCWRALRPRGRQLLAAYYLEPRADLAAREGLTLNALRLRVFKEKKRLRACVCQCQRRDAP